MTAILQKPWKSSKNGFVLQLRLAPRANRNAVLQIKPEYIKISIKAPPVDNKANEALISFLSGLFSIAKSYVSIKSGFTGRNKSVEILGVTEKTLEDCFPQSPKCT